MVIYDIVVGLSSHILLIGKCMRNILFTLSHNYDWKIKIEFRWLPFPFAHSIGLPQDESVLLAISKVVIKREITVIDFSSKAYTKVPQMNAALKGNTLHSNNMN